MAVTVDLRSLQHFDVVWQRYGEAKVKSGGVRCCTVKVELSMVV